MINKSAVENTILAIRREFPSLSVLRPVGGGLFDYILSLKYVYVVESQDNLVVIITHSTDKKFDNLSGSVSGVGNGGRILYEGMIENGDELRLLMRFLYDNARRYSFSEFALRNSKINDRNIDLYLETFGEELVNFVDRIIVATFTSLRGYCSIDVSSVGIEDFGEDLAGVVIRIASQALIGNSRHLFLSNNDFRDDGTRSLDAAYDFDDKRKFGEDLIDMIVERSIRILEEFSGYLTKRSI